MTTENELLKLASALAVALRAKEKADSDVAEARAKLLDRLNHEPVNKVA